MHDFLPSQIDQKQCVRCKRPKKDHTVFAECEACGKLGPCELHVDILLCKAKCYPAEMEAIKALQDPVGQEERVNAHNAAMSQQAAKQLTVNDLIKHAEKVDQSIELQSDFYNAETAALIELVKAIDSDSTIENKPLSKAQLAMNRIKTYQQTIFDAKQAIVKADNELRANKAYLNEIISTLREEEREQFRLKDIAYPVKPVKTPKSKSQGPKKAKKTTKIDFVDVNKWAAKVGVSGNAIHSIMAARGCNAEAAARHLAKLLEKDIDA